MCSPKAYKDVCYIDQSDDRLNNWKVLGFEVSWIECDVDWNYYWLKDRQNDDEDIPVDLEERLGFDLGIREDNINKFVLLESFPLLFSRIVIKAVLLWRWVREHVLLINIDSIIRLSLGCLNNITLIVSGFGFTFGAVLPSKSPIAFRLALDPALLGPFHRLPGHSKNVLDLRAGSTFLVLLKSFSSFTLTPQLLPELLINSFGLCVLGIRLIRLRVV